MKISKKDARMWLEFFAELPEDEEILPRQQEILYAALSQIEAAVEKRRAQRLSQIKGLKSLKDRTFYVGPDEKFPRGCISCLLGTGLSAIRKTNRCNLRCPFCYDFGQLDAQPPIGEGYFEIGGGRVRVEDLPLMMSIGKKPSGVAYVYLEPFMEIEVYADIIRAFREAGVYQHMYTNGTLATQENLQMLADAGLDELRFNLGASGCAQSVIDNMRMAARILPRVGVETPMTREFYAKFHEKKDDILSSGIGFINCAELHLNENNIANYEGEPMYMHRLGYLSPIISRDLTIELMDEASREQWDIVVHDCANRTKFARDLNLKAHEGGWFGATAYGSEFPRVPAWAFLSALADESLQFEEEEPMPAGYGIGDIVL